MNIRIPSEADLPDIALVLRDTGLFPIEFLDGMIAPFFNESECMEKWLVCEDGDNTVIGFCYARPEPLTEGTWNLLAIGLRNNTHGCGYGTALITAIERALVAERVLIVETSSLDAFKATRTFYEKCGYEREAIIRDYWTNGDDKVIYRKTLS